MSMSAIGINEKLKFILDTASSYLNSLSDGETSYLSLIEPKQKPNI